jgi:Ca-activated chloride channel family protein
LRLVAGPVRSAIWQLLRTKPLITALLATMFRYWPTTIATLLVLTSCSQPQPTTPTVTAGEASDTPPPVASEPPPPPPPSELAAGVEISKPATVEEHESAFHSNQWNSAVGLGGGTGGRHSYGGRSARRGATAESYASLAHSGYLLPEASPMSTFAADVDTASFTNVLRRLKTGDTPAADSVRLEEFVNAMRYDLAAPGPRETFAIATEVAECPWNDAHELVRIAVRTKEIETAKLPPCNLVFLIDISGSMSSHDKLPLLKRAFGLLIDQLRPQDHVSIVTYASGVNVVLDSANGAERTRIHDALAALQTRGGTNGQGGIQTAYELATRNRVQGINRVLLATDGDFNVGIQSADELEKFITKKKELGVFLSVLGFGTGNLKDDRLERLANRGDGVYSYIADLQTARRVLVEQFGASMMTIAKDVKLQTEWNKNQVARFRLLGYENRALSTQDFKDDKKDGGEVGAGHSVTALYEIERVAKPADASEQLATLRIRYKPPQGETSREISQQILPAKIATATLSKNGHLAATAAAMALHLRGDEHRGSITQASVIEMAAGISRNANPELRAMADALLALPRPGEIEEPGNEPR